MRIELELAEIDFVHLVIHARAWGKGTWGDTVATFCPVDPTEPQAVPDPAGRFSWDWRMSFWYGREAAGWAAMRLAAAYLTALDEPYEVVFCDDEVDNDDGYVILTDYVPGAMSWLVAGESNSTQGEPTP